MRRVTAVTTSRADYGIFSPILDELEASQSVDLDLAVTGAHLSEEHGSTVDEIGADGREIETRIPIPLDDDTPAGIATSQGRAVEAFGEYLENHETDLLLLVGDRYETLAVALAATHHNVPIAHVHGGEVTTGATDDAFRHALTKLAHLHFVAADKHARRVRQMGEEPWRVHVTGAPALDGLDPQATMTRSDLEESFGIELDPPPLLVTYHPVTRSVGENPEQIEALLEALDCRDEPVVFTGPNTDAENHPVRQAIEDYVEDDEQATLVEHFGQGAYHSMMHHAKAMVGNSSSGLLEAPTFDLPVVNVGERQAGRLRGDNVIDVPSDPNAIAEGIREATSKRFIEQAREADNPYRQEDTAQRIRRVLETVDLDERLVRKPFVDHQEVA